MKVYISRIFQADSKSADNDTIGKLVNVILDYESLEARLLVFPETKSGSWLWTLLQGSDSLIQPVTDTLGLYESASIISGVSQVGQQVGQQVQQKQLTRAEQRNQSYVLMPVSELRTILDTDLILEQSSDYYQTYMNMPVGEVDLAFYHDGAYRDPQRAFGISLNLIPLFGNRLRDCNKRKGRIIDLQFDVNEGLVNELVIRTPGKGSLGRRIAAEEIDFANLECQNAIQSYPQLQRS